MRKLVTSAVAVLAVASVPAAAAATATYYNPFSKATGLVPERIDMGVDFNANAGSPIRAIGDFRVYASTPCCSHWHSPEDTQAFVGYTLLDGPYKGRDVYVAEDIVPQVSIGQTGTAGQTIATFKSSSTGLETGWADTCGCGYGALASEYNQPDPNGEPGGWISAAGASFENLLWVLRAPQAPNYGGTPHGTNPAGYPPVYPNILPLMVGSHDTNTSQLQNALRAHGYLIPVSRRYGLRTYHAVRGYESANAFTANGIVTQAVWNALI